MKVSSQLKREVCVTSAIEIIKLIKLFVNVFYSRESGNPVKLISGFLLSQE